MDLRTPIPVKLYNFRPEIWEDGAKPVSNNPHTISTYHKKTQLFSQKAQKTTTYDFPKDKWQPAISKPRGPNTSIFGAPSCQISAELSQDFQIVKPSFSSGPYNHTSITLLHKISPHQLYTDRNLHNQRISKSLSRKPNLYQNTTNPPNFEDKLFHLKVQKKSKVTRPVSAIGHENTKIKRQNFNRESDDCGLFTEITKNNIKREN